MSFMVENTVSELYNYLRDWNMVGSINDFGEQTHIARSIASLLISGKTQLTERYIKRICSTFSFVNPNWLRSGEGEMFIKATPIEEEYERLKPYYEQLGAQHYEEQDAERELTEKAAAYDEQCVELNERIAEDSSQLAQKEEQILALSRAIMQYKEEIRKLRSQLAGLIGVQPAK